MGARLLPDVLAERAREVPDALALIVDGGGQLTFRRWEERSNAFARGLRAMGLRAGSRLGLLFESSRLDEYAIAYLGAHKAAIAAVPLSWRSPRGELEQTIVDAGADAVVYAHGQDCPGLAISALSFAEVGRDQDLACYRVPISSDDLAEVVYTSGTTGARKGVAATHGNIAIDWEQDEDARYQQRYFLHAAPFGTNAGQVTLRGALRWPPTTLVLPDFDQLRFCELIEEFRVTSVLLVPAMALWLIASGCYRRFDLSSVREVTLTAAAMPPAAFARLAAIFPNAVLNNSYTSTEAWPARTNMRYDPRKPLALGRPVAGQGVGVTGPAGDPLPPGQPGDIWLRAADGVPSRHYLGDPAGAGVFRDGWVKTGDLGYLDSDGFLFLTGRQGDLINTGGFNVSALEVEAVLHENPAVSEAAVLGLPHEVLGHTVAAAVVAAGEVTPAELRAFAAERLPDHKVPAQIVLLPALPRNSAHKLLKDELRRLLQERRERRCTRRTPGDGYVAPRTELETMIARLWGDALGADEVGVTDDFFEAGGNSLIAKQLVFMIQTATGARLPIRGLFLRPTVEATAAAVEKLRNARRGDGEPRRPAGPAIRSLNRATTAPSGRSRRAQRDIQGFTRGKERNDG